MNRLNEFIIPYLGLSNGTHQYHFEIGKEFFAQFEMSKMSAGKFDLKVELVKDGRMIILMVGFHGYFTAPCDRCLSQIEVPMDFEDKLIIKIEDQQGINDPDVYYLDPGTSHIDISTMLYESLHLNMPMKNVRDCESENNTYCDLQALGNLNEIKDNKKDVDESNVWKILDDLELEKD